MSCPHPDKCTICRSREVMVAVVGKADRSSNDAGAEVESDITRRFELLFESDIQEGVNSLQQDLRPESRDLLIREQGQSLEFPINPNVNLHRGVGRFIEFLGTSHLFRFHRGSSRQFVPPQ